MPSDIPQSMSRVGDRALARRRADVRSPIRQAPAYRRRFNEAYTISQAASSATTAAGFGIDEARMRRQAKVQSGNFKAEFHLQPANGRRGGKTVTVYASPKMHRVHSSDFIISVRTTLERSCLWVIDRAIHSYLGFYILETATQAGQLVEIRIERPMREICSLAAAVRLDENSDEWIACQIENISENGAKLRRAKNRHLPPIFTLQLPLAKSVNERRSVELLWRTGTAASIRFLAEDEIRGGLILDNK